MYQCPLCHEPLIKNQNSLTCNNRHQFDFAKEGYINLMPVQHKRSKDPGDNKEMMQSRRRFLEKGFYTPMRSQVTAKLSQYVTNPCAKVLDIGCGEGFYTNDFALSFSNQQDTSVFGLDISKVAIKYAAKRYKHCEFCVASSNRLPFGDKELDAVVRIYAPCNGDELQRCIKSNGIIVTVTPAGRHLYQLKELIYSEVHLHDETPESIDGFELIADDNLHYPMSLDGESAFDLLQMTPFAWRASEEIKQDLKSRSEFHCEADFSIRVFRKIN
ncbi:23S rRNA (guanine(745)-N(1))-methyltransferase [Vibrio viridaestus]|uniref:23S rRNA (Guanine(745)-N(1))-methyltransferase n=1 Tax=Vibrio viridaestus TaxID=2487322 RepID=A0A3N9TI19_9VIBR|nr:23S rRNA (guanine(745)-N(1))-methyltransferase [Vibrio viridaestus]RQW63175.1 23S rRNA (guanine(745)-N(1))-methyltransferase [Vibrio viridaestus]